MAEIPPRVILNLIYFGAIVQNSTLRNGTHILHCCKGVLILPTLHTAYVRQAPDPAAHNARTHQRLLCKYIRTRRTCRMHARVRAYVAAALLRQCGID
eukprot:848535-Ditylum_brightwellii.AAC.1